MGAREGVLVTVELEALGTYVQVVCPASEGPAVERLTRRILAEVDRTCSRFRRDSDLSRANARAGRWTEVDPLLVAAVEVARCAAEDTDGLVTPLLGHRLVALGYDRDLAEVRAEVSGARRTTFSPTDPAPARSEVWRRLEWRDGAVRVPAGNALDLGSTGKAWASDLVAGTIRAELGAPALVSLGGDIATTGSGSWPVGVQERPDAVEADQVVWLEGGGLATSSTTVRRWSQAGVARHHVLDPRTGLPTRGPWRTVTATGPTCVAANTAATAALVLGEAAVPWLAGRGVDARLVAEDGSVHVVGQWPGQEAA